MNLIKYFWNEISKVNHSDHEIEKDDNFNDEYSDNQK